MSDPGYVGEHMTTTTTTTTVQPMIRIDISYIRTLPGILKVVQVAMNLLGFICIMSSGFAYRVSSRGEWFSTVSMSGFWITLLLLGCYLSHLVEKFYKLPWLLAEFIYCAILTFFYLIAASLCADWGHNEAFGAAAFFGYCAMTAYGADAFLKFRAWRAGEIAQGERTTAKTSSTVTSPAY